jgi:hypothetical protein
LSVHGERKEVAIPVALSDSDCLFGDLGCGGEVSRGLVLEHHREEQIAVLGALALPLEEAVRAAKPSRRGADLTT